MTYENNNASHNILMDNNAKDAYNKLPIYNERLGNANTVIIESVNDNNKREFAITHGDTDAGISQDLERIVNTKGNPTVEAHHLNEVPARYDNIVADQKKTIPPELKAESLDGSFEIKSIKWDSETRTASISIYGRDIVPTINDEVCWGNLAEGWAQLIFPKMTKANHTYHIVQKNLYLLEYVPTFFPTGVKDTTTTFTDATDYQTLVSACGFPNKATIDVTETNNETGEVNEFHIVIFSDVTYKTLPAYKPGTVDKTVVIDGVKDWSEYVTKPKTEDEPDSEG